MTTSTSATAPSWKVEIGRLVEALPYARSMRGRLVSTRRERVGPVAPLDVSALRRGLPDLRVGEPRAGAARDRLNPERAHAPAAAAQAP